MPVTICYVIIQKTPSPRKSEEDVKIKFVNHRKGRSSLSQIFFKIRVHNNFANFTGKHLCWRLFYIKFKTDSKACVFP